MCPLQPLYVYYVASSPEIKYMKVKSLSRVWIFATPWMATCQAPLSMVFSGKNTRVGCHLLLQGIIPSQESNPGILHYRQILCHLSHQDSPMLGLIVYKCWERALVKKNKRVCSTVIQFSSVAQWCPSLCNPRDCSMPGFPVYHQLLELAQTHVRAVGNAIQPFHLLLFPSLHDFNLSLDQGLFQWVSFLHQVDKVLGLQLQHQSFQWIFRTDFL